MIWFDITSNCTFTSVFLRFFICSFVRYYSPSYFCSTYILSLFPFFVLVVSHFYIFLLFFLLSPQITFISTLFYIFLSFSIFILWCLIFFLSCFLLSLSISHFNFFFPTFLIYSLIFLTAWYYLGISLICVSHWCRLW